MTREEALSVLEAAQERMNGAGPYTTDSVSFRELTEAAQILAQPVPRNSRWVVLPFNSGSGKTMWRCGICGRLSNTPDKRCPDKWGCDRYTGLPGLNNPAPDDFR